MTDHEAQVIAHVRHRLDVLMTQQHTNANRMTGTQARFIACADELNQLSMLLASIQGDIP